MIWQIWILVPVLYGLFTLWYFNWGGPIRSEEVDKFLKFFSAIEGSKYTDAEVFRKFLEEDDGKEFVMANFVRLRSGDVAHPVSGEMMTSETLIRGYLKPFVKALLRRGGHPVYQARKKGGYIDSWNGECDSGYGVIAMMRYRSRRDLVELIMDPRFAGSHIYKLAAIEKTFSFPTQIMFSTYMRPEKSVFLLLLLLASVAQNIFISAA